MNTMQIFNILLFWLFFGFLTSHLAKKRGRHPLIWFALGVFLGIFALLLVVLLPRAALKPTIQKPKTSPPTPPLLPSETAQIMWYYLDSSHESKGPLPFSDLIEIWKQNQIHEASYLWGEGMKEWQRLSQMPDLQKELREASNGVS